MTNQSALWQLTKAEQLTAKIAAWPDHLVEVLAAVTAMHGYISVQTSGAIDVEFCDEYGDQRSYVLRFKATDLNVTQLYRDMDNILFERDCVERKRQETAREKELKVQALAKLTDDEKRALGLG